MKGKRLTHSSSSLSRTAMKLVELLKQKRTAVGKRWVDLTLQSYPADTQRFLKKQRDPFANPVGTTISKEIEHVFDELLQGAQPEKVTPFLDRIVRIRAVQDFSPSQAVVFIFLLKKVIRTELAKEILEYGLSEDLVELEARIDDLALLTFDLYIKCREKLYEIKAKQASRQVSRLLRKAGLTCEIPPWQPEQEEDGPVEESLNENESIETR